MNSRNNVNTTTKIINQQFDLDYDFSRNPCPYHSYFSCSMNIRYDFVMLFRTKFCYQLI